VKKFFAIAILSACFGAAAAAAQAPDASPAPRLDAGKFGQALALTAQPGPWVEAAFPSEYAERPITVEGWVKLSPGQGRAAILSAGIKESPAHWALLHDPESGLLLQTSSRGAIHETVTGISIADGDWHYLALLLKEDGEELFIDGASVNLDRGATAEAGGFRDALQIEDPSGPENLAFAGNGAKPATTASEHDHRQHGVGTLNDGGYGNRSCWIPAEVKGSFEIDLGSPQNVHLFTLGRDRSGQIADRGLNAIQIETAAQAGEWQTVFSQDGISDLENYSATKTMGIFIQPVEAQYIRVTVEGSQEENRQPAIDEFAVYGPDAVDDVQGELPAIAFSDNILVDPGLRGPLYFGAYPIDRLGANGMLDELRISKGLRDVSNIPSAAFSPDADTLGLWHFDAYDGATGFADDSARTNHAEMAPPAGNPVLALKRGITMDRRQWSGSVPPPDGMTFEKEDVQIMKGTGADHIKVLVTPATFMTDDGIDTEKMWYIDEIVNKVLDEGLPIVVCIHPEPPFKNIYLGSSSEFQKLLTFYGAFAGYMAKKWTPEQLVFELMTEPYGNSFDWDVLQYRLWESVRETMPDHTLVLSGDETGHVSGVPKIVPLNDPNVYYKFTSYDPILFTFQGGEPFGGIVQHLTQVPYPSSPEIVEARMDQILAEVPADRKDDAREAVRKYGEERWNKERLVTRLQPVLEWNEAYGGGLKIWCGEFGALDPKLGSVKPSERWAFIRDLREAFEESGITWAYWSYNETFTILTPEREPFDPTDSSQVDAGLVEALGLHAPPAAE